LGTRIASALVLAPVVLIIVWLGGWWTTGLIAAAVVIGIYEIQRILRAGGYHPRLPLAIGLGLAFVAAAVAQPQTKVNLTGAVVALGAMASLIYEISRRERTGALDAWAASLGSAIYAGAMLSHFVLLRAATSPALNGGPLSSLNIETGAAWIYATFAVTWASDTGAYFAGRTIDLGSSNYFGRDWGGRWYAGRFGRIVVKTPSRSQRFRQPDSWPWRLARSG